jgi:hypothetical protein
LTAFGDARAGRGRRGHVEGSLYPIDQWATVDSPGRPPGQYELYTCDRPDFICVAIV